MENEELKKKELKDKELIEKERKEKELIEKELKEKELKEKELEKIIIQEIVDKVLAKIEGVYFWIFPYVGGVLMLIAFLTPAGNTYISSEYVWIWGFVLTRDGEFTYMNDTIRFLISVFLSFLILLIALTLIRTANNVKNGKKEIKDYRKDWIYYSFFILIITTSWAFLMELSCYWNQYIPAEIYPIIYPIICYHFWGYNYYQLNYGIYGMFIAATFTIVGLSLMRSNK